MTDSKDIAKEVAKEAYADLAHPVAKSSGELLGLVPRAIKAALTPVEKWILQKEYNIAETKKLLEEKLKNVPPEQIQPPEAYIAVPALQYISYCMDNQELRDMYANLLASSMVNVVKNGVHPGFVEIIKQLCPDEAKILRYFSSHTVIPTITLHYKKKGETGHVDIVKDFSNIGEIVGCEQPYNIKEYFDNLIRLGLLDSAKGMSYLTDKSKYEPLKSHEYLHQFLDPGAIEAAGFETSGFDESIISLTDYGESFCRICLTDIAVVTQS